MIGQKSTRTIKCTAHCLCGSTLTLSFSLASFVFLEGSSNHFQVLNLREGKYSERLVLLRVTQVYFTFFCEASVYYQIPLSLCLDWRQAAVLGTISKSRTQAERVLQYEAHFQESV